MTTRMLIGWGAGRIAASTITVAFHLGAAMAFSVGIVMGVTGLIAGCLWDEL